MLEKGDYQKTIENKSLYLRRTRSLKESEKAQ